MNQAEHQLIEDLKTGDERAFDTFLSVYGARLHSFASKMCRHREDAQDAVQETLIAVFRSLQSFRGESSFRAWLFKIASNACWKMRRKGKFEPEQELRLDDFMPAAQGEGMKPEVPDWSQNPDELFQREEIRAVVDAAIAELPKKYRIVLVLRDIEQLTTDETAEALGLTPEAVKSRLHRARLFLRDRLSHYWLSNFKSEI